MPAATDARTASAVTRAFFRHLEESEVSAQEASRLSGVHANTLYYWKTGKAAATVLNMESVLAVLGLELVIRPINPDRP